MNRILILIVLLGVVFVFMQIVLKKNTNKVTEESYTVVKKFDNFEIRKYPELFVASTLMDSSGYENNSNNGFRTVAGYIFGGNEKSQKIAMTSPVIMDLSDSVEMSFIMPNEVTAQNAPNPSDTSVQLKTRPGETLAVIRFSGWASSQKLKSKTDELIGYLKKQKIDFYGDPIYMGYNPPYQVVDRRNEIAIRVKI